MNATRSGIGTLLVVTLLGRFSAAAPCDPTGTDEQDVGNARVAIAQHCDCDSADSHGDYVRCAREQAEATLVNQGCRSAVARCASRSTCGRSGAVSCCRTNSRGVTRCAVKSSAAKCTAPNGGQACVGSFSSCCDACDAGGCVAPTTPQACSGGSGPPQCDGTCPAGMACVDNPGSGGCVCTGSECGQAGFPQCGGVCPGTDVCMAFQSFDNGAFRHVCACWYSTVTCSMGTGSECVIGGRCPPEKVCTFSPVNPSGPAPVCGCVDPL